MAGGMPATAPYQQPGVESAPGNGKPAPSRRNLLLALTGGAAVVVGGGTAVAVGLGGSSGTTAAADSNPAVGGAAPSAAASSVPGLAAPSSANAAPSAGQPHPLPPTGSLPPPAGAVGTLQGPAAAPFWTLPGVGRVTSLASAEGVLVMCGESGVSGFDLGGNAKWGPVRAAGVVGSGDAAVAGGVVHLIVAAEPSERSGTIGDLLALDVMTGAQKWRAPLPQGSEAGVRVGGVLGGMVFLVGTVAAMPFLAALDAATGRAKWQKTGVQFATLALPTDGTQVLVAGTPGPDAAGTIAAVDIHSGDQVWARPLKTSVDYSHLSLAKAAYVGDRYVLLLADAQNPGTLVGGSAASGQTTWNAQLTEPAGDAGTLATITRSPDATAVVALSGHGIYAAEAQSGKVLWQSQGTENFDTASGSGAPQIADGNVYVYDQKGTWWAVDLATGGTRWQYPSGGLDQAADPVWIAVPGGVVVAGGGKLALIAAHG
jgi:outer membrane protein assembly factor BamB